MQNHILISEHQNLKLKSVLQIIVDLQYAAVSEQLFSETLESKHQKYKILSAEIKEN